MIFFSFYCRISSRVNKIKKRAVGILGGLIQGRKRNYNIVSEQKIGKMMELNFQKRSEAKIRWALKAYHEWRTMRVDKEDCPKEIIDADLDDIASVTKVNLEYAFVQVHSGG